VKKHLVRIALGLLVVLAFLGHAACKYEDRPRRFEIPLVDRLEAILYDVRLRLTMPGTDDPRIVVVDIDEDSLQEEGRWPWRRDRLGVFLDRLFDTYGVRLVAFDVIFAERDKSSGLPVLQQLANRELKGVPGFETALMAIEPTLEFDRIFAKKMRGRAVVLSYYLTNTQQPGEKAKRVGVLPPPVLPKGVIGANITVSKWSGYGANLPELQAAAASAGHINPLPDEDGVMRRVPMLAETADGYYEPLSLAVVRLFLGLPEVHPGYGAAPGGSGTYPGLEWLDVGPLRIPVDNQVAALVPYRGEAKTFKYISATKVLKGEKGLRSELEDKIVLVGTSAPGLLDMRSTPVGGVYPGVEIHANLISGMLDGTIKQRPSYVLGAEVLLLALAGLIMALVLPLLNPIRSGVTTVAVLGAVVGTNLVVWQHANLVLPLASGLLMILVLFALNMSYGFFVESRAKRQITGRFGQYVPPELVDEMAQNPNKFSMEGESREMSVLFSDVRGFTTISEGLDPKQLSQLMNEFLTPLTRVLYRHRGTIDKYMGDCIMAFWGAPLSDPQHARNAVLAGLEMQAAMDALQPQFHARGWPELHIGVGVNSGRMSVGNMGSDVRVAYTVMGGAVNLASRLEGLTKQYGVGMIVGEATRVACPDVVFRELDRVMPKGTTEPVAIFAPVGPVGSVDQSVHAELALWHEALKQYRAQEWELAEQQLRSLQRTYPSTALYAVFVQRIAHLRANPPGAGWDGTTAFETK
jgi:adenylate cyclase